MGCKISIIRKIPSTCCINRLFLPGSRTVPAVCPAWPGCWLSFSLPITVRMVLMHIHMSSDSTKQARYERLYAQILPLMEKTDSPVSRMATIVAVLHHKMQPFFWTGFYLLQEPDTLLVGPYQGPLACLVLRRGKGVCWAAVEAGKTLIVPDVHQFPGHVACDSRSQSEIVVPLTDPNGRIVGVLDVDSDQLNAFDATDALWLEKIVALVQPVLIS